MTACAWCGAYMPHGEDCPVCGKNFAKAKADLWEFVRSASVNDLSAVVDLGRQGRGHK